MLNLFTKTQPKQIIPSKRKSLMENHGFEVTAGSSFYSFSNKFKIRTDPYPKKSNYRRSSADADKQDFYMLFSNLFNRILHSKGKVIAKDLYDIISNNYKLTDISEKFYNAFKFKIQTEITLEEALDAIFSRSHTKNKTCIPKSPTKKQEIPKITGKDMNMIRMLFDKNDLNKDGYLNINEFKKALVDKYPDNILNKLFHNTDTEKKGMISFQDFLRLI